MSNKPDYEYFKKENWLKRNSVEIATIIVGLIVINLIFLAKAFRGNQISAVNASYLGAFISGYIGTFFALVSVVFLYSTLKNQRRDGNIEKFENKYFELIRLHRDNVSEIGIGNSSGKKIFVLLIRELRAIVNIVKRVSIQHDNILGDCEKIFATSYLILFYGIGPNSTRILKNALKNNNLTDTFIDNIVTELSHDQNSIKDSLGFTPFIGQQSILGHYYRHLYQTVWFVDNKRDVPIDRYGYVKTVRAQLTNHEQALLFINSLSSLGKKWWDGKLMIRYKLVKNLPKTFFDPVSEIDITTYFPKNYFES